MTNDFGTEEERSMKKLKLLVTVALLGGLAWRTNWEQVGQAFRELHLNLWLAALGMYLTAQVLSAVRWRVMARPLGFKQPMGHFIGYYFIGMFFNQVLPTSVGGDVVRAWYLDDRPGRRLPAFVSVFVDRFSGLLVLLGLACVAVVVCPLELPSWVPWSVWGTVGCAALGLAAVVVKCRMQSGNAAETGEDGEKPSLVAVLNSALAMLSSAYLSRPWLLLGSTVLSVGVQIANVVMIWLIGLALGAPVPGVYYWIMVPMVSLWAVVLPSINGMGVREGGVALFLVDPLGISQSTALTIAILWFAVVSAANLCGGIVYLFGCFPRPEVQTDHEPLGDHSDQGRARQPATAA